MRELVKLTDALEQRGFRRNSQEGLIELERAIAGNAEAQELMIQEHIARQRGTSILEFSHA